MVLYGTIRNDDFQRNTASQPCCDIESNSGNVVSTLQRCVALNPFAPGDFAEKRVLKLVEWFSGHCRAIKS